MIFLLDNHVPPSLVQLLSEFDIESVHVKDEGLAKASDVEIVVFARERGYVVVTSDSDYPEILALSGAVKPSVVYLTSDSPTRPEPLSILLANALPSVVEDLEKGAVVAIGPKRIRVRDLPI